MAYNIIFDIDQTIVDSSSAEEYRSNGNWDAAIDEIDVGNVKPFTGMVELIREARTYGHDIAFVSTSPDRYCRRIFQYIGLDPDDYCAFIPYNRELYQTTHNKKGMYNEAISHFQNKFQPLVIVGDSNGDISSANGLEYHYNRRTIKYRYNLFTIRCLWGMSDDRIKQELDAEGHPEAFFPYLIMKNVTELRDFLFYNWSIKTDENGVTYAFNYFPTGVGRFHDIFSDYFQKDIKGNKKKESVEIKPVFIRKWAAQYLISYIEELMRVQQINDAGSIGIMIVPSSPEKRWNAALEEILNDVVRLKEVTNCAHVMVRHTGREAAHNANDRTVETNVDTMRIDDPDILRNLSILIILDDITTTGNTYKACDEVIKRDAAGIFSGEIKHVALAKTKTLHFEGNRNNTCEAKQVAQAGAQKPGADTYWAVNSHFEFNRIYHRNEGCVKSESGIKWGFVGMEGVRYYLPLDCQLCDRCGFPNNANES